MLAAILIIYQTALGRAFSGEKGAEISKLVEVRERTNTAGNVEQYEEQWTSCRAEDSERA